MTIPIPGSQLTLQTREINIKLVCIHALGYELVSYVSTPTNPSRATLGKSLSPIRCQGII